MPFIDFNSEKISFKKEDFDFVVVGCGAAGILLAVELQKNKKKVLVIESGHFFEDDQRQELNDAEQTGKKLNNIVWGRKRAIGGTTIAWGGQSLPFGDIDFEQKDWVKNSGWPIVKDELKDYYDRANRFMKIDEYDYEDDIFRLLGMKKLPFNEAYLHYHFSKWAPEPNFKKLYQTELTENIPVLYNAVVKKINIGIDGKAENVEISNFNGDSYLLGVSQLILAGGAIETTRLLLESNNQLATGIGNSSGLLGKFFMEHPCIQVGYLSNFQPYYLQSLFNTHIKNKRKYSIRISLSEQAQRDNKLLNCSAGIMFDYAGAKDDPYIEAKKHFKNPNAGSILHIGKNLRAYAVSARAYAFDNFIYKHQARAKLVLMTEQEPVEDSYIALSNESDQFGMRKAKINWTITRKSWETIVYTSQKVRDELSRMSLADLKLHPEIHNEQENWLSHMSDVNHHMGGTRMSSAPGEGVVNEELQVWGHDNIYVCSCSVFPTSSHSNPTLTMMALCLRLVTHLLK